MPRAFTQNLYHAVFGTKGRRPVITPDLEPRLHSFMVGVLRDLGCWVIAIDGTEDHVHLLVRYPSDLSHADMIRHVKSRSSKWVHQTYPEMREFAWQEGYGGFTVSSSMAATVESYIKNQKPHHATRDFGSEFLAMLRLHRVEFDEGEVFP